MDIPIVLGGDDITPGINNNQYKELYWGSCASTYNTYAQLLSKWPGSNPTLPTEQDMQDYYDLYWGIV